MSRGQDQLWENGDELWNVGGSFICDKCKVEYPPNNWMYEILENIHLCEHCLARGIIEYGTVEPSTVFHYKNKNYALSVYVVDKKQNRYINSKIRKKLLKNSVCNYCKTEDDLQIDHVIPVSKGGKNHKSNYHQDKLQLQFL